MGRRVELGQKKTIDPLIIAVPWGDFEVRPPARSVLKAVSLLPDKIAALGDAPDPDELVRAIGETVGAAVVEPGFAEGLIAAWNAEEIDLSDVSAIGNVVADELVGDVGEV